MIKIGIVDDNKDQRETNKNRLTLFLRDRVSDFEVIDIFPFKNFSEYYTWIHDENLNLLIFDEKLYNDSQDGKVPVDYNGSDLVIKIRERYKDIPIFTLTNFPEEEDLQRNFNQFEHIIAKDKFDEKYTDIIIRASNRYFDENQKELFLFDELTKKIALGDSLPENLEKLKALQIKLNIPLSNDLIDRNDWLIEYEIQIKSLEQIRKKLEDKNIK